MLDNAEAQREKEKATLYTRNAIIDALQVDIPLLVETMLKAYAEFYQLPVKDYLVTVEFGDYANPSFESQVETISKAKTGGIMSIEAAVDELYGDDKDEDLLPEYGKAPRRRGDRAERMGDVASEAAPGAGCLQEAELQEVRHEVHRHQQDDALFSYSPIEHGIFINKDVLKSPKTLDAYTQRSQEAWDLVMNNMDKLSEKQRALAERYAKAGRDLVSGDTVEGLFTHELGHHVQWTMLNPKTTNSLTSRMSEFAPHISGYATASNSEYLAESFAAYMKGERQLLDSEYVKMLDAKFLKSKKIAITGKLENVKKRVVFTKAKESDIISSSKQMGKKIGKHTKEYGLDPSSEEDRRRFIEITQNIITNHDEIREGTWRSKEGLCDFYIKDNDVVVVHQGQYVTTLKGGVTNERVKNARRK